MPDRKAQEPPEQPAHPVLREDPRNHLDVLLGRAHGGRDGGLRARLQRVGVQAGGGLRDARPVLLLLVQVLQHRERFLADERVQDFADLPRLPHPDLVPDLLVHHVLDVDFRLHELLGRVQRQGQRVQHPTQDLRLDKLQIHRVIRHRGPDDLVGLRVGAERRERPLRCRVVLHDLEVVA